MSSSILKHISEEKDIARYKLALLEKGARKQYKDRLIAVERDFIEYPFEKLSLSSVDEYRRAMATFRSDRALFYTEYEKKECFRSRVVTESQTKSLSDKVLFFDNKYQEIIDYEIKKLNLIESKYLQERAGISEKDLASHGMDYILGLEGAALSKHRARIQILMYCMARFIHNKVRRVKVLLEGEVTSDDYDATRYEVETFFKDFESSLFKYYNDAIREVPLVTNGTLGHNSFISTIYPLSNILDKYSQPVFIKRLLPKEKAFFSQTGRPIKKKFVERGFGIVTPMMRVGNESLDLLYLDIWSESGVCLTDLFSKEFFNLNTEKGYVKAVAAHAVWTWPEVTKNPFIKREAASILGLDGGLSSEIDLSDKSTIASINSASDTEFPVNQEMTKILIASTRSESDHIKRALSYIKHVSGLIQREFEEKFSKDYNH